MAAPVDLHRSRREKPPTSRRVGVTFVMEQHLGHRTYYENLRAHVDSDRYDAVWVPVDYAITPLIDRVPVPKSVKVALSARQAVRRGIRSRESDVHVFNTQVPAVLGGRLSRSRPYIVITDVTPKQYDRMADGYGHRADRPGPVAWVKHRLNKATFADARWCVGWSRWVCESFVADYGIPVERTRTIPPGVDTSVWRPGGERDDGVFRVLFVGGDFERKGGHELLRAFASLPDDSELVLVTRSEVPRSEHVRVVNDLGPNDPRLIELYRSSDVFAAALASRDVRDSRRRSRRERAAGGGDRCRWLARDIVEHDVSGFTLPAGDWSGLSRALGELRSRDLRQRMAGAARERAEARLGDACERQAASRPRRWNRRWGRPTRSGADRASLVGATPVSNWRRRRHVGTGLAAMRTMLMLATRWADAVPFELDGVVTLLTSSSGMGMAIVRSV